MEESRDEQPNTISLAATEIIDAFLALPSDVPAKIAIAEEAISTRLRDWGHVDSSEHMALEDASRALRVLLSETKAEAA